MYLSLSSAHHQTTTGTRKQLIPMLTMVSFHLHPSHKPKAIHPIRPLLNSLPLFLQRLRPSPDSQDDQSPVLDRLQMSIDLEVQGVVDRRLLLTDPCLLPWSGVNPTSLLFIPTHRVLVRPSQAYLNAPLYGQERNISGMSTVTASTSEEQLVSPYLFPTYHQMEVPMAASHSLPEMTQRQQGSPISRSRSPIQAQGIFFASPEQDQGAFGLNSRPRSSHPQHSYDGDISLMCGVPHVMRPSPTFTAPGSTMMPSTSTFSDQQHPHVYRQETDSTIVGTPLISQDRSMSFPPQAQHQQRHSQQSQQLGGGGASQGGLAPQSQFHAVSYPTVPNLNRYGGSNCQSQSIQINEWASQTFDANSQPAQQPPYGFTSNPPPLQRHASASVVSFGQPQPNHISSQPDSSRLAIAPMLQRSVSAPFEQLTSTMPSMSNMPTMNGTHGLFGAIAVSSGETTSSIMMSMDDSMYDTQSTMFSPYHRQTPGSASLPTSPETPRSKKRVFPRVGKPLRPGPRPKPRTPKGSRSSSTASPGEMGSGQGGIDPALLSSKILPSIAEGEEERRRSINKLPTPTSPRAEPLEFGPELATVAMQRATEERPLGPTDSSQPQLVIDPPRTAIGPDGQPIGAGLPKSFLERLYTTFFTMEGSMTNQPTKRFKCLIEGCERHFPRKSAIHSHIQTHLEDKPYVCPNDEW